MSFEQEVKDVFKGAIDPKRWRYEEHGPDVELMIYEEQIERPDGIRVLVTGVVKDDDLMYIVDIVAYQLEGSDGESFRIGQLQEGKLIERVKDALAPYREHMEFFKKVLNLR